MVTAADTSDDTSAIELIEPDSLGVISDVPTSGNSSETVSSEPIEHSGAFGSKYVIAASILAIVIALALFSRPGPPVSVDDGAQTTVAPTSLPTTSIPGQTTVPFTVRPPVTQAIPNFDGNVTDEIPGVISGFDVEGSLIVIDREEFRPEENRLELTPTETSPGSVLMINGGSPLRFVQRLIHDGSKIEVELNQDRFVNPSFRLSDIVPDSSDRVVLLSRGSDSTMVTLAPLAFDNPDGGQVLRWTFPGEPNVLGHWANKLVVERAGEVWLVDEALESTAIATGKVLVFDGAYLARLTCDGPVDCQITVGSPDQPDARSIPLPPELALIDDDGWTGNASVSPDGSRLALSVRRGGLTLPMVVDLDSGDVANLADGMNHDSPVVWSPDGDWLAYLYTNDVMVWRFEQNRSWRVPVNRNMVSLLWR